MTRRELALTAPTRIARITAQLSRASEPTLAVIERALGITTAPDSPDAGRPFKKEASE